MFFSFFFSNGERIQKLPFFPVVVTSVAPELKHLHVSVFEAGQMKFFLRQWCLNMTNFRLSCVNDRRELAFNLSLKSILYKKAKKFTIIDCKLYKLNSW